MTDYLHALPPGYRIEEYKLVRVPPSSGARCPRSRELAEVLEFVRNQLVVVGQLIDHKSAII